MIAEVKGDGPLLVFGGPYSNLQATQAMRDLADRLDIPPQRVICTGDLVAYGAHPNETAALIRDWGCLAIQGNCEAQLAARAPDCGCGFEEGSVCDALSAGWYGYADRVLEDGLRAWMGGLPTALRLRWAGRELLVVHGGVEGAEGLPEPAISRFRFASDPAAGFRAEFAAAAADIVLAGHAGIPFLRRIEQGGRRRLWVNAGVIGVPANDGRASGWFALLQRGEGGIEVALRRLDYDAAAAAADLRVAGAAPAYADAMETGLWPSLDILPERERAASGRPLRARRLRFSAEAR